MNSPVPASTAESAACTGARFARALYRASFSGKRPRASLPDAAAIAAYQAQAAREGLDCAGVEAALVEHLPRRPHLPDRKDEALARALVRHYHRQAQTSGLGRSAFFSDGSQHLYQNGHALVLWKPERPLPPGDYALEVLEHPERARELLRWEPPVPDRIAETFSHTWPGPYMKPLEEAFVARTGPLVYVFVPVVGAPGTWGVPLHHMTPLLAVSAIQLDTRRHWAFARRSGLVLAVPAFPEARMRDAADPHAGVRPGGLP
ncbi:hypothetical protein [Oceanithermus sp.]|uniref:hypothetical protein n=1 Tax=Oceanithermus sp. TaxID=2268145 RepID=UPI002580CFCD|nr:hypothetical protein [Oceanithermus sp.]